MNYLTKRFTVLTVLVVLVSWSGGASAYGQGVLVNGEKQEEALVSPGDSDNWSFDAEAGDNVFIKMRELSADTQLRLLVFDPDGSEIHDDWTNVSLNWELVAEKAGQYVVMVSDRQGNEGGYEIAMTKVPGAYVTPEGDQGGELVNGDRHVGELVGSDFDHWTFDAEAGDNVFIKMRELSTDTQLRLLVFDPDGSEIHDDWTNVSLNWELVAEKAGQYVVMVSDRQGNEGGYEIAMTKVPGAYVTPEGDQGGDLVNGDRHVGELVGSDFDHWTFDAEAGDNVFIKMRELSADTQLRLLVFDPDGSEIHDDWTNVSLNRELVAEKAGQYVVMVSDRQGNEGGYEMAMTKVPGAYVTPEDDEGGELANGSTISGTIDHSDFDIWEFFAETGDSLQVVFTDSGNSFTPRMVVFDAVGSEIFDTWTNSASMEFEGEAGSTGLYRILLMDRNAGIGEYTLSLLKLPPTLYVPEDPTIDEMTSHSWEVSCTNPLDAASQVTFELVSAPEGVVLETTGVTTASVNWTPSEEQGPGEHTITVVAFAPTRTLEKSFTVTVEEVNTAPRFRAGASTSFSLAEEEVWTFSPMATDSDLPANGLSYRLESDIEGLLYDAANHELKWTPGEAQGPGTYTARMVVIDSNPDAVNASSLEGTLDITFTITEVNVPPALETVPAQSVQEGDTLTFNLAATDADLPAQQLTYDIDRAWKDRGASINPQGTVTWVTDEADGPASFNATVSVSDGVVTTEQQVAITVAEVNVAPSIEPIADQSVEEGTLFSYQVEVSDPDLPANPLRFSLDNPSLGMGLGISSAGLLTWTPGESAGPGTYTVVITVGDESTSVQQSFSLTVNEINEAPTGVRFEAVAVRENLPAGQLLGTLIAEDPDNGDSHVFRLVSGFDRVRIEGNQVFSTRALDYETDRSGAVEVRATDAAGASVRDSFSLLIENLDDGNIGDDAATWSGLDIGPNGVVATGDLLGDILLMPSADFVWLYEMNTFAWVPEPMEGQSAFYLYVYRSPLDPGDLGDDWHGFASAGGGQNVFTGNWLGWVDISTDPFLFIHAFGSYFYLLSGQDTTQGAWFHRMEDPR